MDGGLDAPFRFNENGEQEGAFATPATSPEVWTATLPSGRPDAPSLVNCTNWTSTAGDGTGGNVDSVELTLDKSQRALDGELPQERAFQTTYLLPATVTQKYLRMIMPD